ncbi:mucin-5AC-like [Limulus polyphemus]|uniref:Mucin-5AC-like n=1 Tax=Limulus polyphemus TaxID=6850 RepID=A0ABM1S9P1_LIMPO|nr:mucin-5AC-like [Limulus polyphemus]
MILSIVVFLEAALAVVTASLMLCWILGLSSYFIEDDQTDEPKTTKQIKVKSDSSSVLKISSSSTGKSQTSGLKGEETAASKPLKPSKYLSCANENKKVETIDGAARKVASQTDESIFRRSGSVSSRSSVATSFDQNLSVSKIHRPESNQSVISSVGDYDPWGIGGLHCVEHSMTENGWAGRESSAVAVTMDSYSHTRNLVSRERIEDYVEEDDILLGGDATNFLHVFSDESPKYFGIPVRIFYHSHSRRPIKITFKKYKRITLDRRKWFRKIKSLVITQKIGSLSEIPPSLKRFFSGIRKSKSSKIQGHETFKMLSRRPQQSALIPELKGLQTQSPFLSRQGIKASSPTFHLTNLSGLPSVISTSESPTSQGALFQDYAPATTSSIFTAHIGSPVPPKISPTNLSPFQNLSPSNTVDLTSTTSSNRSTSICIPQMSIIQSPRSISPILVMQQIPDSASQTLTPKQSVSPIHNSFLQRPIFPSVIGHQSFTLQPTMKEKVSPATIEIAERGHSLPKRPVSPLYQPFRSSPTLLATEHQTSQPVTFTHSLIPSSVSASVSPPKRPTSPAYQHFTGLPTPTSLVLQQRSLSQPPTRNISPIRLAAVDSPSFKPSPPEELILPTYQYFPQTSTSSAVVYQHFLSQSIPRHVTELTPSKPLQQNYQFPIDCSQVAKNDTQLGSIRRPQSVPTGLFSFSTPSHIQTLFPPRGTPSYHTPTVHRSVSPGRSTGFLQSLFAQRSLISEPVRVKETTSTDTFVHKSVSPSPQNLPKPPPTVHPFVDYTRIATQPKEADYLVENSKLFTMLS